MKKRLAGEALMFSLLMIGCGEAPEADDHSNQARNLVFRWTPPP
jgi:hypothetical protein